MQHDPIFERIILISREVFKQDDLLVTESSDKNSISGWDSISNLFFIDSVEKAFQVKFDLDDIMGIQTVGDMVSAVKKYQY
jgi:acyl carrier protein